MLYRQKEPDMDWNTVSNILEKSFDANNMQGNRVPLKVLASYSNYRKEKFTLQRVILAIVLTLFLLLPLMFLTPDINLSRVTSTETGRPEYALSVKGIMPIKRISAAIDDKFMPVYNMGNNHYTISPNINGHMLVTVTYLNDQSSTVEEDVKAVDIKAPTHISDDREGDCLSIWVVDEGLGVDYEGVYAISASGRKLSPVAYDEAEGKISFEYPRETVNIFVPDKGGNTLQLVVAIGG